MLIIIPQRITLDDFFKDSSGLGQIIPRTKITIQTRTQLEKIYEIYMTFQRTGAFYTESTRETLGGIFLNKNRQLIAVTTLSRGNFESVAIPYAKIRRLINDFSADPFNKVHYMAFFHNHPNGLALPSEADIASGTYMMNHFLESTGVQILEDFIAGQVADLRFTDTIFNQEMKASLSPLTSELFLELKRLFHKTHPEWFHLENKRGFYFLSKDGICPGIGLT